ncbi:ComEA family DNA-binding protein [Chryseolinea soli]|uniref:Helix-hairpin-helix domain-containing protein n=1 Tax=Chryseolinea soli TaxID=2321403 RepID=A0A385SCX0_9BACT|nr:helix-hairpin-helix domain-containing protein [Chryseolinea soli]AYB29493.1 helix-hairpin-helix domain-containing protein [Chryseolinea soli]
MNRIQRWVRDYFGFSRSQVNAFLILLPLMMLIVFAPAVWKNYVLPRPYDDTKDRAMLDSLVGVWEAGLEKDKVRAPEAVEPSVFRFDPNTATVEQWRALGLSAASSTRIAHYREKGGKFRVKADLLKIYGIDPAFYHRVFAYIALPENKTGAEEKKDLWDNHHKESRESRFKTNNARFDINAADTAQLKSVYGIGEKLSQRILKYRDALGGFVTLEQLTEIYGLDTAVVTRLKTKCVVLPDFRPDRININQADEKRLAAHPYLKSGVARIIVAYRFQHGEFRSVDDLRKIQGLDPKIIDKIAPYLTL